MDRLTDMQTKLELMDLCHAFSYYLDYRQYDRLVDLFTENAVWGRIREVHHGRDEILQGMKARGDTIATRHIATNFYFEDFRPDTIKGVVYNYSVYGPVQTGGALPATYGATNGHLLDFHDVYRRTSQGWRFAERIAKGVMLESDSNMMKAAERWGPCAMA